MNSPCLYVFLGLLAVPYGAALTAYCQMAPNRQPGENPSQVTGSIVLEQRDDGGDAYISMQLYNVGEPYTEHGIHIHESGDIYSRGCQSAGGHFNPLGRHHGGRYTPIRHVGDFGNVRTDASGHVWDAFYGRRVSLKGPNSVVGRSFVIHAKRDDLGLGGGESLQNGNSGARLGCCVIYTISPDRMDHWSG